MRRALSLVALALVSAGMPARVMAGPTVPTLGSYFGFDWYEGDGRSFSSFSTSPSQFYWVPEPGLRFGLVTSGGRVEWAALLGLTLAGSDYEGGGSVAVALEGLYCFQGAERTSPYIGAHAGLGGVGYPGTEGATSDIGVQLGLRRRVGDGHGALKFELRGGVMVDDEGDSLGRFSIRMGYDLWLR